VLRKTTKTSVIRSRDTSFSIRTTCLANHSLLGLIAPNSLLSSQTLSILLLSLEMSFIIAELIQRNCVQRIFVEIGLVRFSVAVKLCTYVKAVRVSNLPGCWLFRLRNFVVFLSRSRSIQSRQVTWHRISLLNCFHSCFMCGRSRVTTSFSISAIVTDFPCSSSVASGKYWNRTLK
jgi:hypothetical protein